MKVSIQEVPEKEEEEIIIKCHEINEETTALLQRLKDSQNKLTGTLGSEIHKIALKDIYYFETVDNKSFFYCRQQVYETKLKLYEFEEAVQGSRFFRASKSTVVNTLKISYVKPAFSGRFEIFMENGESLFVSRQYVPELKKQLGL